MSRSPFAARLPADVPNAAGPIPPDIERLLHAEERRHTQAILDLIGKRPEYRAHLSYVLLGGAIAVCDSFGCDVQGFLDDLRRCEPMPPVLVPPKDGAS